MQYKSENCMNFNKKPLFIAETEQKLEPHPEVYEVSSAQRSYLG